MVRKEVWAHLLVYNIVRTLMAKAAAQAGARPEEISFKGALQAFNAFWTHLLLASTVNETTRLWTIMMAAIAERRVGDRPDRYEPRAVRRSPKKYGMIYLTDPSFLGKMIPDNQGRQPCRERTRRPKHPQT
jgi:hypothetical protein